ncbi:hypothetical protein MCAV_05270 [[Mycoplasma] cavipharyngis]
MLALFFFFNWKHILKTNDHKSSKINNLKNHLKKTRQKILSYNN